jgi:hypothetical protein
MKGMMTMITYESMKMFLVTFAFESLVILIAVAIIYGGIGRTGAAFFQEDT